MDELLNLADFERAAAERQDRAAFDYVAGGAGDELTLDDNLRAFRRWRVRPRVLVDVSSVDLGTTFLGRPVALPFGVAPVAFQHLVSDEAEPATARAAAAAGVCFCLSTMSSRSIEEVAAAAPGGERWFQLYVHRDRARSADLVQRAEAAGYGAIVVTADFAAPGLRERDRRNGLGYPQAFGNFEPPERPASPDGDESLAVTVGSLVDPSFTWRDLAWLRGVTDLPLVIKGVLTAEDALIAAGEGVAGVVVSNHGGRQLDRTPATIDVLGEVVDAAAGRLEVYLDGGVRRGVDVIVALALGARGVFLGRPFAYGLAVAGAAGVGRAIELLAAELRTDLALVGVSALDQLNPAHVLRG